MEFVHTSCCSWFFVFFYWFVVLLLDLLPLICLLLLCSIFLSSFLRFSYISFLDLLFNLHLVVICYLESLESCVNLFTWREDHDDSSRVRKEMLTLFTINVLQCKHENMFLNSYDTKSSVLMNIQSINTVWILIENIAERLPQKLVTLWLYLIRNKY